ncbi:MAG: arylsulfotransferase family protein [Alphaproteobacteria bacterium]
MMLTRLLFILFLCSVAALLFGIGVLAQHYGHPAALYVDSALKAYDAEKERLPERAIDPKETDSMMTGKRVEWNKQLAYDGLTLITIRYSTTAYLLDMEGNIRHRWDVPFKKAWKKPRHVSTLVSNEWIYIEKAVAFPNGDLLLAYTAAGVTPYGYGMVKVDKDSRVIWKYSDNTHHDFSIDPATGNILALTHRLINSNEPGYRWSTNYMLEDFVVLLSPAGKELQRISVFDAFYDSPYRLLLHDYHKNVMEWDRLHTNHVSIITEEMARHFPMFKAGQYLLSLRNMDALAVLDPQSKKIVWAFNGLWRAQHSPQLLENGNILLFDNKGHVIKDQIFSRVLEFNPKTLGVEWSYIGSKELPFYTDAFGRVQRLDNGNTLITESMTGRVFEITPAGKTVWQFKLPMVRRKLDDKHPQPYQKEDCIYVNTEEPLRFDPSLSGIIVSATRYNADALPFIHEKLHKRK